ncbi:MAG: hypothetical protein FWF44_10415 [Defluviitaleaceae bacterium]|nr:hypothetical protein [Defluviitaleaceae bacterium]
MAITFGCGIIHHFSSSSGGKLIFRDKYIEISGGFFQGGKYVVDYSDIDIVEYSVILPKIKIVLPKDKIFPETDLPVLALFPVQLRKCLNCFKHFGIKTHKHHNSSIYDWFTFWYSDKNS